MLTLTLTHNLLQIPNFLHLTPAAIKKHCEALKCKFLIVKRKAISYFLALVSSNCTILLFTIKEINRLIWRMKNCLSVISVLHRVADCLGH